MSVSHRWSPVHPPRLRALGHHVGSDYVLLGSFGGVGDCFPNTIFIREDGGPSSRVQGWRLGTDGVFLFSSLIPSP